MGKKNRQKPDEQTSRSIPLPKNAPILPIINALVAEHDRGCVMVGAAFIEYRLEQVLRKAFSKTPEADTELIETVLDFKNANALLSSGWSKSVIARLIGILSPQTYAVIGKIRKLRNDFAHTPRAVELNEEAIKPILDAWGSHECFDAQADEYESNDEGGCWNRDGVAQVFSRARVKFMHACLLAYATICTDRDKDEDEERLIVYSRVGSPDALQ